MPRIHDLLAADHDRLDHLLRTCAPSADDPAYIELRRGLLRHIGIEERLLFPLVRRDEKMAPVVAQLHRDHAALTALLVPPPTRAELDTIAGILAPHNALEEELGGVYEAAEAAAGAELPALLAKIDATAPPPLVPNTDAPIVRSAIEQLVREAAEGRAALRTAKFG